MVKSKRVWRPTHGQALEDYILMNIGYYGIMFHKLYERILESYGYVSARTVHRRLVRLRINRKILKIIESPSNTYYRLSKT